MSEQGRRWNELPHKRLEDHGFSINRIKDWRKREFDAGRPSTLSDFYDAHGLCFDCQSMGVQYLGERNGSALWDFCGTCRGTGLATRAEWQRPISTQ
jgi:hypothetical protein